MLHHTLCHKVIHVLSVGLRQLYGRMYVRSYKPYFATLRYFTTLPVCVQLASGVQVCTPGQALSCLPLHTVTSVTVGLARKQHQSNYAGTASTAGTVYAWS